MTFICQSLFPPPESPHYMKSGLHHAMGEARLPKTVTKSCHPEVKIAHVDYLLGTPSFVCGTTMVVWVSGAIWVSHADYLFVYLCVVCGLCVAPRWWSWYLGPSGYQGEQSTADKNTKNTATPTGPNTSNIR